MISWIEFIGYVASFFVAISLLMSSFLVLRVLNLIGAVSFVVYGALIGSIPIVLTNAFITIVDVFYLIRLLRPDLNGFQYLAVGEDRKAQLEEFVTAKLSDILRFFPDFSVTDLDETFERGGKAFVAMRHLRINGFALSYPVPQPDSVSVGDLRDLYSYVHEKLYPEQALVLPVDYVVAKYRGVGVAQWLFRAIERATPPSVQYVLVPVHVEAGRHRGFLKQQRFESHGDFGEYRLMVKTLQREGE